MTRIQFNHHHHHPD
ncbi:his operon leader peptide [Serratia plymuthica]